MPEVTITARTMQSLADANDVVAAGTPRGSQCVYYDYPIHANVGDLLIALGAFRFFEKHGVTIIKSRSRHRQLPAPRSSAIRRAPIFLHGGGNFGDLYDQHQLFREDIIKERLDAKIIGMPQSAHYRSKAALQRTKAIYNRHPDLTLFARDSVSLDIIGNEIDPRVRLAPDMAHQLWPDFAAAVDALSVGAPQSPTSRALLLLRTDAEVDPRKIPSNLDGAACVDWDALAPRWTGKALYAAQKSQWVGPYAEGLVRRFYRAVIERICLASARRMAAYDVVQTSRLHGVIMAALLGKAIEPFDNHYGKIARYCDTWFPEAGADQLKNRARA